MRWTRLDHCASDSVSAKHQAIKRLSGRFFVLPPKKPPSTASDWLNGLSPVDQADKVTTRLAVLLVMHRHATDE